MPADIAKNLDNVPERRIGAVSVGGACELQTHKHTHTNTHKSKPTLASIPEECDASVETPVCVSTDDDDDDDDNDLFVDTIEYDDDCMTSDDDEYFDADLVKATLKTVAKTNNDDSKMQYVARQNAHKQSVVRSYT